MCSTSVRKKFKTIGILRGKAHYQVRYLPTQKMLNFMFITNICKSCINQQLLFYQNQLLCKSMKDDSIKALTELKVCTGPPVNTCPLSSTHLNTRRGTQFFGNFRHNSYHRQSRKRFSSSNMPKRNSRPEVAKRSSSSSDLEIIEQSSSSEGSP